MVNVLLKFSSLFYILLSLGILFFLVKIHCKTPIQFKTGKNNLKWMYFISIFFAAMAMIGGLVVLLKHQPFGFWILSFTSISILAMLMLYVFKEDIKKDKLFHRFVVWFFAIIYVIMFASIFTWINHPTIRMTS